VEPGSRVEVRSRFDRTWARGFEVAEIVGPERTAAPGESAAPPANGATLRYRVRRRSDGAVLPALFSDDEVREEKRSNDMWWI